MPGMVTFNIREPVMMIPSNCPLLETDSSYPAPVPYCGEDTPPVCLILTAVRMAEALVISIEEIAKLTNANAQSFFRF